MNPARSRTLLARPVTDSTQNAKTVLYWSWRDVRAENNWALIHAQECALKASAKLAVLYVLVPHYERFTWRHYHFLVESLRMMDEDLRKKNIPLYVIESDHGSVAETVARTLKSLDAGTLVCDMTPTRSHTTWLTQLVDLFKANKATNVEVQQVDAHNIVPVWKTSPKMEWAARTIRPKIHSNMNAFLETFMEIKAMPSGNLETSLISNAFLLKLTNQTTTNDWERIENESRTLTTCDKGVEDVDHLFPPGPRAALERLNDFLHPDALGKQSTRRNDPNYTKVSSGLSPYLNFGAISAQFVVQRVQEWDRSTQKKYHGDCETFLEELIVRRELSDNFCFYNPMYDSISGGPEWGQITLGQHESDRRDYTYTYEQWESCQTHDKIWNASMMQLRNEGKMHGFLRMYWAKKILEWSASPAEALEIAIRLNDRWALDGNDNPNGFVGIMWSICGVHDQGWAERAVFGKIRYMNDTGCKRKFDVAKFIERYPLDIKCEEASLSKDSAKGEKRGGMKRSIDALTASHKEAQKNGSGDIKSTKKVRN